MTKNGRFKIFLQKTFLSVVVCSFFLLSPGLFQYDTLQSEAFAQTISFTGIEKVVQPAFLDKFNQGAEKVKIIVLLKGYKAFEGLSVADDAVAMKTVQSTIRSRQERVLTALDPNQFQLRHRFENILGFSGEATLQAIKDLAKMDEVEFIEEDKEMEMHTSEGIPLIGANGLHSMGIYGSGVSIAIVDTGVDYTHPELGNGSFPNTKVIGGVDTADNDSDPMPTSASSAHGTAVAGVAAGDSGGGYFGGVAPSAKIYALKVFKDDGSGLLSDTAEAWDWCVSHKNDDSANPILIINNSLGEVGGYYTSTCDGTSPTFDTAAANVVDNGMTLFASSGNEGFCDGLGFPACMTNVISVGAVYDANIGRSPEAGFVGCISNNSCVGNPGPPCEEKWYVDEATAADQVTTYSNSASFLDILAAANCANTTDIVGSGGFDDPGNYDSCFTGTSAACPYAAGAGALLQEYAKTQTGSYLTPAQLKSALVTYGDPVTDSKNSLTHPRVNTLASTAGIGGPGLACPAGVVLDDGEDNLDVLRELRDTRMASTASGELFISLYYEHAEEISDILLADESLKTMAANVVGEIIEKALALNSNEAVSIDQGLVKSILEVADAIDEEASPGLKIAIKKVKKEIKEGTIFKELGIKAAGSCG